MPAISRFFGIVITMNYNDHPPPHFHVRYGNQKALIAIDTLGLIHGHLPPRVLGFVVEWASQHQSALAMNWDLAKRQQPLQPIQPLE
ncbi:MAG: transcriptional regulator [Acidobacteria bacterium RIFCSPLOWO2_12_FULL_54_10]|nr:MAG: transcriptional regulator [Acidobacteria bacterium RIFCSPLOWO2_12_FULL_54_10]